MKLSIFISLLFFTNAVFAQKPIELNEKYFVDIDNLEKAIPEIEIRKYINFEKYQVVIEAIKSNNTSSLSNEYIQLGLENELVKLKQGNYFLKNEEQEFKFEIDEGGLFSGIAELVQNEADKHLYITFNFEDGKVKEGLVRKNRSSQPVAILNINDNVFMVQFYNDDNKLIEEVIAQQIDGVVKEISTEYYEDGSMKSERNEFTNEEKRYFQNGKLEFYRNEETNERKEFNENGKMTSHFYLTDTEKCTESYKNGLIYNKDCSKLDYSGGIEYFYINGELESYIVHNNETHEYKKYDKNNKLIESYIAYPMSVPSS